MAGLEHLRDLAPGDSVEELIARRKREGWRIGAIEWQRDLADEHSEHPHRLEPVPFGLRVANDCHHLESDPTELEILTVVTEMIVQERRLPAIADALNERGYRTREGARWTPTSVFELMPRMIDSSPKIFSAPEWPRRRTAARH